MVRMCPALNKRVKILASQMRIIYEPTNSFYHPKTLQYLMEHSEIAVTMDVYTHLGLDDAKNEIVSGECEKGG